MKKLLALLALASLPLAASASTKVFPAYPIPIPCTQGGTAKTSAFGTGDVIIGNAVSCTNSVPDVATGSVFISQGAAANPRYTTAPAMSGANITSATIPNASLVSLPDVTTCGTWTPTDASDASLPLTVNSAMYCHTKHGDGTYIVALQFSVTYPPTASASNAVLGGLPYTPAAQETALAVGFTNIASALNLYIPASTANIQFRSAAGGAQITNSTASTHETVGAGIYQSTN